MVRYRGGASGSAEAPSGSVRAAASASPGTIATAPPAAAMASMAGTLSVSWMMSGSKPFSEAAASRCPRHFSQPAIQCSAAKSPRCASAIPTARSSATTRLTVSRQSGVNTLPAGSSAAPT